ncbi:M14 family metallopeptidase [Thalassotalea mangrovi]|nr:M14 metallopeptidase family protein [Thalassotalea mangrovi]
MRQFIITVIGLLLLSGCAANAPKGVTANGQIGAADSIAALKSQYQTLKQESFDKHTIYPTDIYPLIEALPENPRFKVSEVGKSFLAKPIYHIQVGEGNRHVFMWSQMHGDEPTATASVFDLINYIDAPGNQQWFQSWKDELTLHIVPMVNPDGAEQESRFNAQGIDINRDAKRLQTPEGRVLLKLADSIQPEFGFNLHDQNRFYTTGESDKPATISVLAPAFNDEKDLNVARRNAMKLIGLLNDSIQKEHPGNVGRYDDTYSYRSFGDLFSGKGIATTLIESGGHHNDPNRQVARWLTFMMLVQSIDAIAQKQYVNETIAKYEAIPMNQSRGIVDVLVKNVSVGFDKESQDSLENKQYLVDISLNLGRKLDRASIAEIGDISHGNAFNMFDMSGYQLLPIKGFEVSETLTLSTEQYKQLLSQGFSYFIDNDEMLEIATDLPVVKTKQALPERPQLHKPASFLFSKEGKIAVAIINGQRVAL